MIVETRNPQEQSRLEHQFETSIEQLFIHTPVSVIVHDIAYVNCRIARTEYSFADIKKEGIILYDSNRFKLEKLRQLNFKDRYYLAREDYEYWLSNVEGYRRQYELTSKENQLSIWKSRQRCWQLSL